MVGEIKLTYQDHKALWTLDAHGDYSSVYIDNRAPAVEGGCREDVYDMLAERWGCEPNEIVHDVPEILKTAEDQMKFGLFMNGYCVKVPLTGGQTPIFWVGLTFNHKQREQIMDTYANEASKPQRFLLTFKLWPTEFAWPLEHPCYKQAYEEARRQSFVLGIKEQRGELSVLETHTALAPVKPAWGFFDNTGQLHITSWSEKTEYVPDMPFLPGNITKILEKTAEPFVVDELKKMFPSGQDVVQVPNWERMLASKFKLPKRYEIGWRRGTTVLLVRIPADYSNEIRCPAELRGHVIGKQGSKIKELANRHGYRFLKLV